MREITISKIRLEDEAVQIAKNLATEDYLDCNQGEIPKLHVIKYLSEALPGTSFYCITTDGQLKKGEELIGTYSDGAEFGKPKKRLKL